MATALFALAGNPKLAHSQERPATDGLSLLYAKAAARDGSAAPAPAGRAQAAPRRVDMLTAVAPVVSVIRVRTLADGTHVLVCDTERRVDPPRLLDAPIRTRVRQ